MLSNLLKGRLDRRAFIVAAAIASAIALGVMLVVLVPIALIGIVAPAVGDSVVFKLITVIAASAIGIPYAVLFASLIIRRVHDFGGRGSLWLFAIFVSLVLERVLEMGIFRLLAVFAILILCVIPGNKVRNYYGAKPNKKFKLDFSRWYSY